MSDVCDWRAGTPFNKTPFDPIVVGVVEPATTVPGNVLTCELVPSVPVWVTPVMLKFAPAAVVAPVPPLAIAIVPATVVAVAALPVMLIGHVPDVPTPFRGAAPRFASAPAAVVAPVPPDAGSNGDPSVSLPAATVPENDALVPLSAPVSVAELAPTELLKITGALNVFELVHTFGVDSAGYVKVTCAYTGVVISRANCRSRLNILPLSI